MLDLRLKGLKLFDRKPMPSWGADLSGIDAEGYASDASHAWFASFAPAAPVALPWPAIAR